MSTGSPSLYCDRERDLRLDTVPPVTHEGEQSFKVPESLSERLKQGCWDHSLGNGSAHWSSFVNSHSFLRTSDSETITAVCSIQLNHGKGRESRGRAYGPPGGSSAGAQGSSKPALWGVSPWLHSEIVLSVDHHAC